MIDASSDGGDGGGGGDADDVRRSRSHDLFYLYCDFVPCASYVSYDDDDVRDRSEMKNLMMTMNWNDVFSSCVCFCVFSSFSSFCPCPGQVVFPSCSRDIT